MRIGIPRALYYYRYFPFWQSFFEYLGCQVVVSEKTTRNTMDLGVSLTVDGLCLPVKVYVGHVHNLMNKDIDYLFVPRIISVAKREYICPKFMGLPDIVKNSIENCPPLLAPVVDGRKSSLSIMEAYIKLGMRFAPLPQVFLAYLKAVKKQHLAKTAARTNLRCNLEDISSDHLIIGILGHEYLINDDYINMGTIKWLQTVNCQVITIEELTEKIISRHVSKLTLKRMFWTSGKRILGAFDYFCRRVDGIISIAAFSCGTDSLTIDLVERYSYRYHIPHLQLSLDEHTGETGVITRLEAFLELLIRRKKREVDYTPHG